MNRRGDGRRLVLTTLVVWLAFPATASASPWTVPQDDLAVDFRYDFQRADREYLPDGTLQPFPLDGSYTASQLSFGARYGFTDRVEGAVELNFKQVSYSSEPFVASGLDNFEDRRGLYEDGGGLIDFSETRLGASDFYFRGRYNFLDKGGLIKLTTESELKLPAGYDEPSGTFAEDVPVPGDVRDDVTLGDGQVDLTQRLLFGAYIVPTRTFVSIDAGYEFRFGPPGDRLLGGVKVGQNLGDNVVVFAGSRGRYTTVQGESIGVSFITRSPELEPYELGSDEIEQVPLFLDKSSLDVTGGIIFKIGETEVQFAYNRTVLGENRPLIQTVSVGTSLALSNVAGRAEDSSE